jgi:hypothetical protein
MFQLTIAVDGEGSWPDLAGRAVVLGDWTHLSVVPGQLGDAATGADASLAASPCRGASPRPSSVDLRIGIRVELPDGRVLYTETSWALLYVAAQAIEKRHGAPR